MALSMGCVHTATIEPVHFKSHKQLYSTVAIINSIFLPLLSYVVLNVSLVEYLRGFSRGFSRGFLKGSLRWCF